MAYDDKLATSSCQNEICLVGRSQQAILISYPYQKEMEKL